MFKVPYNGRKRGVYMCLSLSIYVLLFHWSFDTGLDVQQFTHSNLNLGQNETNIPFILYLNNTEIYPGITFHIDDRLADSHPLPAVCTPELVNGTFDENFALSVKDLPSLTYAGSLLGRHGVHVWFTAGLASEMDARTANKIVPRAHMTSMSQKRLCSALQHFHPDHTPADCDTSAERNHGHPPYSWPWCFPPTDPVHIMSIDCGIVDNHFSHPDVTFTLFTDQVVVSTDRGRWKVQPGVPVAEFDELAIMGAAEYATEPGHFPNEDLGALLLMDMVLPRRVPLLWPHEGVAVSMLNALRDENLLSDRKIIKIPSRDSPMHYRARRIFYFRTNREWDQGPWVSWYTQRILQQLLLPILARRTNNSHIKDARHHIVVFQRRPGTKRSLANHNYLMERLREWLPESEGFSHESFVPGSSDGFPFWDVGERTYKSCLIIGPHGGNMPNMIFMRPGCWVIEIGYEDPTYPLPSDFYCFARNLGLTYWLSIGDFRGSNSLTANLDDIHNIINEYKKEIINA